MDLAPLDFRPTRQRSLQPDLLVVREEDVGEKNITQPLLLAVEVMSPTTRAKDLLLKRGLYEDSGVQGDALFRATRPFPVDVVPARLLEA